MKYGPNPADSQITTSIQGSKHDQVSVWAEFQDYILRSVPAWRALNYVSPVDLSWKQAQSRNQ